MWVVQDDQKNSLNTSEDTILLEVLRDNRK